MGSKIENVVFISIDSLREDFFNPKTSDLDLPALAELTDAGVHFDSTITSSPFTIPSHATMFSGLQPFNHGIRDQTGTFGELSTGHSIFRLLAERGFDVASLDSTPILKNRGFKWNREGNANRQRIDSQIGSFDDPFFLFVHFWDVHTPYYTKLPTENLLDSLANHLRWSDPDTPRRLPRQRVFNRHRQYRIKRIRDLIEKDDDRIIDLVKDGYRAALKRVDEKVRWVLDALERYGKRDETLVVVTSDHGESFNEHDEIYRQPERRYEHGHFLYEKLIRVPAVFTHKSFPSRRIDSQVSTVDYAPTLLRLLGIDYGISFDGEPLTPFILDDGDYESRTAYSEVVRNDQPVPERMRSVRNGTHKLIVDRQRNERHVYDVQNNRAETEDLQGEGLAVEDSLQEQLEGYLNREGAIANEEELSDTELENIESHLSELGYR